jgi:LuxR family maltose regulon positive regulatory protein
VLTWLESLPKAALDARPTLWVMYASALSMTSQLAAVEEKLQAAEAALQGAEPDAWTQNLIGHIAAIRALLAAAQNQAETVIAQSQRALEYLHPNNLPVRTATIWKLGFAYQLQGDRPAARQAYTDAMAISRASGNTIIYNSAATGLGNIQEADNQLYAAAETYQGLLQQAGGPTLPVAAQAHFGLARIFYQWNNLEAAQEHGQFSAQMAHQMESFDALAAFEVFLARLALARGDSSAATAILAKSEAFVRQNNFVYRMPEIAAAQVLTLLRQGNITAAARLAETHGMPMSQARVYLAQGEASEALALLEPLRKLAEAKHWEDERLKVMVLLAVALDVHGEKDRAVELLGEALALAEPGGFIRIFLDEGLAMAQLLTESAAFGIMTDYTRKLLAGFELAQSPAKSDDEPSQTQGLPEGRKNVEPLTEPLSQRELEVLQLIAQGLSNREISQRLFLAVDTVKGHNREIFGKLQVQRRTEAVARARELGLL